MQKSSISAAAGASALLVADFEASEETDAQERNGQEFEPTIQTQSDGDAVAFFKL